MNHSLQTFFIFSREKQGPQGWFTEPGLAGCFEKRWLTFLSLDCKGGTEWVDQSWTCNFLTSEVKSSCPFKEFEVFTSRQRPTLGLKMSTGSLLQDLLLSMWKTTFRSFTENLDAMGSFISLCACFSPFLSCARSRLLAETPVELHWLCSVGSWHLRVAVPLCSKVAPVNLQVLCC